MNDMTIEAFRRRLDSLPSDEVTLERVARTLAGSPDARLKDPVIAEMVERFLLVPTDSPEEIGTERRLEIFMNAGNERTHSTVLGEPRVKNAFIQKFGYEKYLEAAVESEMMDEGERKRIEAANERMFEASERGDAAGIATALNSGADICARDNRGRTVAMHAALNGRLMLELVDCLAQRGCPMDARDNKGRTVAMCDVWNGRLTLQLIKRLAQRGCPIDACDNKGWTVAMTSAYYRTLKPELAECFARLGCPMGARDKKGRTVAVIAVESECKPELIACLAHLGCPMDDVLLGEKLAKKERIVLFILWARYVETSTVLRTLSLFSNVKERAVVALALLSSGISFDKEAICVLTETFSKSMLWAVEHSLGNDNILTAIDGIRFLKILLSPLCLQNIQSMSRERATSLDSESGLQASIGKTYALNLLSVCRSILSEQPENLDVVKAVLSTFQQIHPVNLGFTCTDDEKFSKLLSEVMGRIASLEDEAEQLCDGSDAMPCL